MTHDEMIAVIQAHKEGKSIEWSWKNNNPPTWLLDKGPEWDFQTQNYRIAREPRKCWVKWSADLNDSTAWSVVSSKPIEGSQLVIEQL